MGCVFIHTYIHTYRSRQPLRKYSRCNLNHSNQCQPSSSGNQVHSSIPTNPHPPHSFLGSSLLPSAPPLRPLDVPAPASPVTAPLPCLAGVSPTSLTGGDGPAGGLPGGVPFDPEWCATRGSAAGVCRFDACGSSSGSSEAGPCRLAKCDCSFGCSRPEPVCFVLCGCSCGSTAAGAFRFIVCGCSCGSSVRAVCSFEARGCVSGSLGPEACRFATLRGSVGLVSSVAGGGSGALRFLPACLEPRPTQR